MSLGGSNPPQEPSPINSKLSSGWAVVHDSVSAAFGQSTRLAGGGPGQVVQVAWGTGAGRAPFLRFSGGDPVRVFLTVGSFADAGETGVLVHVGEGRKPALLEFAGHEAVQSKVALLNWLRTEACAGPHQDSGFAARTDDASADAYFHYYGMLMHQQNMLQDATRTGTYYSAIMQNIGDFNGKVVVDVGAGSGILSMFAVQAGARKVYAVEASGITEHARALMDGNPQLGSRIEIVRGRVEEVSLPEKADVLISEPMGTLLVNERMLESYIHARKEFLKPGGKMYPAEGRIHMCAFRDDLLYYEISQRAAFWGNTSFHGVDLSPLHPAASRAYFGQCVVDAFSPNVIISDTSSKQVDFTTADEESLANIDLEVSLTAYANGLCHGVAFWFDVGFLGSNQHVTLSTAPGLPITHWYQLRCVLQAPVVVTAGQPLRGRVQLRAHRRQSYDVHVTLVGSNGAESSGVFDLKEPYYRQMTPQGWSAVGDAGTVAKMQGAGEVATQAADAAEGGAGAEGAAHGNGTGESAHGSGLREVGSDEPMIEGQEHV